MAHTGIRLKLEVPGHGPILEADSDWLHMQALFQAGLPDPTIEMLVNGTAPEAGWHQVGHIVGQVVVWIQPVMLPDEYPDDEESGDDRADQNPV